MPDDGRPAEDAHLSDDRTRSLVPTGRTFLSFDASVFPTETSVDVAGIVDGLLEDYHRYLGATSEDPYSNPVLRLSLEITRRIEAGELDYAAIEQLIQYLTTDAFLSRAAHLARYIGETDPTRNTEAIEHLVRALAGDDPDNPVPFETFRDRVEDEVYGIVITAHPTFNISGELMEVLSLLATGRDHAGRPLTEEELRGLIQKIANLEHRPDHNISLQREHELSLDAIGNIQGALRRVYEVVFAVARDLYPDRWMELSPKLITVASWVGYDLDGRSDIRWTDMLTKRLRVQAMQLGHYRHVVRELREIVADQDELPHTLDLMESRLALVLNEVTDEIEVFATLDPDRAEDIPRLQKLAKRMYDGLSLRLTDGKNLVSLVDRAISRAEDNTEIISRLLVMRAELCNFGLGMAHTHVRINSTQLHNAIRKAVDLETTPDDPRFRQSYLNTINDLLDAVHPVDINFGSVLAERTSAKRLFMVLTQMLKYIDRSAPIRFLIAETESAFTVLTALYYAKLFGIEDHIDICPLFETERALQAGSRVIEQLLENPHFRRYVQRRGCLCIQTGYSDAGRYLGQTPAGASIERLKLRVARLFPKYGLNGIRLVIFDTHGESIGRGGHPGSFKQRLSYVSSAAILGYARDNAISFKQETSFQGGDGYQYFVTEPGAYAALARILEHMLGPRPGSNDDPFYEDRDYVTEFFTTIKEFQVSLMSDPNYGALMSAFGTNLLHASGSRSIKRQYDSADDDIDYALPAQFRAIPQNAVLQQLGLLANTVSGAGEALEKDPEHFRELYRTSPRFRELMGMIEYGIAVSNPYALKAYVDTLDPGLWLLRAARTDDPHHAEEFRQISRFLEQAGLHGRQVKVFRKLFHDATVLEAELDKCASHGIASPCRDLVTETTRDALALQHAIRITLMHEIFKLAMHVPQFSSQHNVTHRGLIMRLLHLDVAHALPLLTHIFPAYVSSDSEGDFGEPATYVSDESQDYSQENRRLFVPMSGLYELVRRLTTATVHRIGFFG